MTTVAQLTEILQPLLTSVAESAGKAVGFVKRISKMNGAGFTQTLVFGWLANPEASLEELTQTAATLGISITPQGLDQRFTPEAAACLKQVLESAIGLVISAEGVAIPILERFNGVYVQDSTTLVLPEALANIWQGCGGSGPEAALKLQVQFDLCGGQISHLALQDGRAQDRNAPVQSVRLPAGALRLADLGFFSLKVLSDLSQQGVFWLTRPQVSTVIFDAGGQRMDLVRLLALSQSREIDLPVQLGAQLCLPARLLGARVPPDVAAERRRRLHDQARKKGQTVSAARLALADWTLLVTNVPPETLTLGEALIVARCRWQIELLFKLWKSHGRLDESRSDKPWRILCEVYAKLLTMLIQHWLFLVSCWTYPDRSLCKAAQTIRKHALHLAAVFAHTQALIQAITVIQHCLAAGCRINKRKRAPHTYQLLLEPPQIEVRQEQLGFYQPLPVLA